MSNNRDKSATQVDWRMLMDRLMETQGDLDLTEEDGVPPKRTSRGTGPHEPNTERHYDKNAEYERKMYFIQLSGREY